MYTTNSFHSIVLLYLSLLLDGKLSELGLAIKETRSIRVNKKSVLSASRKCTKCEISKKSAITSKIKKPKKTTTLSSNSRMITINHAAYHFCMADLTTDHQWQLLGDVRAFFSKCQNVRQPCFWQALISRLYPWATHTGVIWHWNKLNTSSHRSSHYAILRLSYTYKILLLKDIINFKATMFSTSNR